MCRYCAYARSCVIKRNEDILFRGAILAGPQSSKDVFES